MAGRAGPAPLLEDIGAAVEEGPVAPTIPAKRPREETPREEPLTKADIVSIVQECMKAGKSGDQFTDSSTTTGLDFNLSLNKAQDRLCKGNMSSYTLFNVACTPAFSELQL